MKKQKRITLLGDILGCVFGILIFAVPFLFMLINALKDRKEANLLRLSLPTEWMWSNFKEVFSANNYQIITAFKNSIILTIGSLIVLIIVGSMAGYVLQRRSDRPVKIVDTLVMTGLMIPPAILPTIWVMQGLHIYKTMFGMIMVETALQIPFTIMLYKGFMNTIPVELEEAGYIDGCTRNNLFVKIIFPLLKPVTSTIIILNAVTIFNDFTNPLYFQLHGKIFQFLQSAVCRCTAYHHSDADPLPVLQQEDCRWYGSRSCQRLMQNRLPNMQDQFCMVRFKMPCNWEKQILCCTGGVSVYYYIQMKCEVFL